MRWSNLFYVVLPALWLTVGLAQAPPDQSLRDLYCEQCPFDAPVTIPPRNAISPDSRSIGVISIRDMIDQLPDNVGNAPFYLGTSISNLRGLNTAYGMRTLTLLDSRRMTDIASGESESTAAEDEVEQGNSDSEQEESDAVTEAEPELHSPN